MGYNVYMSVSIDIPKEKAQECLAAINRLVALPGRHFSWVGGGPYETLKQAFADWRYALEENAREGYVCVREFTGEKWGDDNTLYLTIAPFVEDGSSVDITGEDDDFWRVEFIDGHAWHRAGIRQFGDIFPLEAC